MSYYHVCPDCGAHLDPGEVCDCREHEKTARGAANTTGGKAEQVEKAVSVSNDIREMEDLQV